MHQPGACFLAAHDLTNANARFACAVSQAPTHQTGNVFYAATRLLTLAYQPAANTLLDRLGFAQTNRSVYDWTAFPPTNTNGLTLAPTNMSAAELTSFLRTNVLTEIRLASSNLANVTNSGFSLTLTREETTSVEVTLDYGDVLLLRAMLQFAQYAGYTFYSWNVDAQL